MSQLVVEPCLLYQYTGRRLDSLRLLLSRFPTWQGKARNIPSSFTQSNLIFPTDSSLSLSLSHTQSPSLSLIAEPMQPFKYFCSLHAFIASLCFVYVLFTWKYPVFVS